MKRRSPFFSFFELACTVSTVESTLRFFASVVDPTSGGGIDIPGFNFVVDPSVNFQPDGPPF